MVWKIELDRTVERELATVDSLMVCRILLFLHGRVAQLEDVRSIGNALKGSRLGEFWKYRVSDYRMIVKIETQMMRIIVLSFNVRRQ